MELGLTFLTSPFKGSCEVTSELTYKELSMQIVCSLLGMVTCFHNSGCSRDLFTALRDGA